MLNWPAKDPNEVLDYQLDWSDRLDEGETITASTFIVESGTITINSTALVGALTTIWLAGGAHGATVVFTNRIVTSQGRTYDQSVRLRIKSTTGT